MTGPDALRIVGIVGERIVTQPTARRDATALVVVVADLAGWDAAADFGGALGFEGDQMEAIYNSWEGTR